MNLFDPTPDLPPCPHCQHAGEGLQWRFPDRLEQQPGMFPVVAIACLKCGVHGPEKPSYAEAILAFALGEVAGRMLENWPLPRFVAPPIWRLVPMNCVRRANA